MSFLGSIGKFLFGSGEKTKVIPPQILPRDKVQSAFSDYFVSPLVFGIDVSYQKDPRTGKVTYNATPNLDRLAFMEKVRDDYVKAYDNYGARLQGLLQKTLKAPIISTPFGDFSAYGLQRAALNNTINWAAFAKRALITPKEAAFNVYYQQPLDMFLKQDLARYRVKADTIYKPRDYGLLPSLIQGGAMLFSV